LFFGTIYSNHTEKKMRLFTWAKLPAKKAAAPKKAATPKKAPAKKAPAKKAAPVKTEEE
jgi:heparin binding hemagglutinin HbhA